jgi:hypothetical protein
MPEQEKNRNEIWNNGKQWQSLMRLRELCFQCLLGKVGEELIQQLFLILLRI